MPSARLRGKKKKKKQKKKKKNLLRGITWI
jgi:hypothetical protein